MCVCVGGGGGGGGGVTEDVVRRRKAGTKCNRVYCIHVPGHDPITFSFLSFSFLIGWDFYGPII